MGIRGSFPRGKNDQGMKLTTHLHLAPALRMHQDIPPFPHTLSAPVISAINCGVSAMAQNNENVLRVWKHFSNQLVPFEEIPSNRRVLQLRLQK
jgi:hypothetical protein